MTYISRVFRKLLLALMPAVLLLSLAVPALAAGAGDFGDVSGSDWYYDAVDFVSGKGLFQGTSSSTFSPNGKMTRAMFITVLGRYAGVDPATWCVGSVSGSGVNMRSGAGTGNPVVATLDYGTSLTIKGRSGDWYQVSTGYQSGYIRNDYVSVRYHNFSDVSFSSYYAGYAIWAYEKGIVNGVGSTSVFSPDTNVTREQACTILSRFASVMGVSIPATVSAGSFTDEGKISSWAKDSVSSMTRAGIIKGRNTGAFDPAGSATRAEAAAILQRFDSAVGGFKAPAGQQGSAGKSGSSGGSSSGQSPAPPSEGAGKTPSTLVGGTVRIPASVIRVGILAETNGFHESVATVTLQNTNGSGFEYGTMDDSRRFVSSGHSCSGDITVTTDGSTFTVRDGSGSVYQTSGHLALHPVGADKPVTCVNGGYRYNGDFELTQAKLKPGNIAVANYVDIEDYVKGVLPYEFGSSWPAETLKAAAVASRTHIMSSVREGVYDTYRMDIVANDGGQLYRGRGSATSATDAAVDATKGLYLTYNGSLCVTSYSACNGGRTASSQEKGWGEKPYLIAQDDPYEQAAIPNITASGANYQSLVNASHRVGMSQWGAFAMANYYSKTYDEILGFYFPGTNLQYGA